MEGSDKEEEKEVLPAKVCSKRHRRQPTQGFVASREEVAREEAEADAALQEEAELYYEEGESVSEGEIEAGSQNDESNRLEKVKWEQSFIDDDEEDDEEDDESPRSPQRKRLRKNTD